MNSRASAAKYSANSMEEITEYSKFFVIVALAICFSELTNNLLFSYDKVGVYIHSNTDLLMRLNLGSFSLFWTLCVSVKAYSFLFLSICWPNFLWHSIFEILSSRFESCDYTSNYLLMICYFSYILHFINRRYKRI